EPRWLVRADRKHGNFHRTTSSADIAERCVIVTGVAREVEVAFAAPDHISAPQGGIAVQQPSAGKVLGGNRFDRESIALHFLPPVQLYRAGEITLIEISFHP